MFQWRQPQKYCTHGGLAKVDETRLLLYLSNVEDTVYLCLSASASASITRERRLCCSFSSKASRSAVCCILCSSAIRCWSLSAFSIRDRSWDEEGIVRRVYEENFSPAERLAARPFAAPKQEGREPRRMRTENERLEFTTHSPLRSLVWRCCTRQISFGTEASESRRHRRNSKA